MTFKKTSKQFYGVQDIQICQFKLVLVILLWYPTRNCIEYFWITTEILLEQCLKDLAMIWLGYAIALHACISFLCSSFLCTCSTGMDSTILLQSTAIILWQVWVQPQLNYEWKKPLKSAFPAPPHLSTISELIVGSQYLKEMNHFHLQFFQIDVSGLM